MCAFNEVRTVITLSLWSSVYPLQHSVIILLFDLCVENISVVRCGVKAENKISIDIT